MNITWEELKSSSWDLLGAKVYWINSAGKKLLHGIITHSLWADPFAATTMPEAGGVEMWFIRLNPCGEMPQSDLSINPAVCSGPVTQDASGISIPYGAGTYLICRETDGDERALSA